MLRYGPLHKPRFGPSRSSSGVAGASAAAQCMCIAGYYGPPATNCTRCAYGKYTLSTDTNQSSCISCDANTYDRGGQPVQVPPWPPPWLTLLLLCSPSFAWLTLLGT